MLDLSNYPKDSNFFDPDNEKVIGKMKDEPKGKINDEFVELKSEKTFYKRCWCLKKEKKKRRQ